MKKILLLLIFAAATLNPYAQSLKAKKYNYWINQAELAICNSNYNLANVCFEKAFKYHKPFAEHLRTAYMLNEKLTYDTNRMYRYATELILCGVKGLIPAKAETSTLDTNVYHRIQFLERTIVPTVDTNLQNELLLIVHKDQSYSHHFGADSSELAKDRSIINDIISIYKRYKKVDDYTAGAHFYVYYIRTPAVHYAGSPNHTLQEFMKKQVLKGTLNPDHYMDIEDIYLTNSVSEEDTVINDGFGYNFYKLGDYLFTYSPKDKDAVNKKRKKLGVSETFDDCTKKVVWQCTHNIFYLRSVSTLIIGNKEVNKEEALNEIKKIEKEHAEGNFSRQYYRLSNTK